MGDGGRGRGQLGAGGFFNYGRTPLDAKYEKLFKFLLQLNTVWTGKTTDGATFGRRACSATPFSSTTRTPPCGVSCRRRWPLRHSPESRRCPYRWGAL